VWVNANRQITGSIRQKYDATNCRAGLATSPEATVAGGVHQQFQRGAIYFKPGIGPHMLSGSVLEFYLKKSGPKGRFGFPTSDLMRLKNGATRATFERGKITCSASGACRAS